MRPEPPLQRVWSTQLSDILHACWHRDPAVRPAFTEIDKQVQQLRAKFGADLKESPAPRPSVLDEQMRTRKSPDMHPIPLPLLPRESCILVNHAGGYSLFDYLVTADTTASFVEVGSAPSTDVSFTTAFSRSDNGHDDDPSDPSRSRASSRASSSMQDSWSEHVDYPRHASPPPPDEQAHRVRDERRYRMLLQHEFHPSRAFLFFS